MAADREAPTVADYVVTAISPVLIMLMVGSLVFFLVEVLYAGKYSDRLLYTMFFFVVGAVLVARIAIQLDAGRATVYGVGLAVVTFLAMQAYVDYPAGTPLKSVAWLVNIGLMALVWWSAHKLTWDCTHIDENRDASGRGLLAAAGLDADAQDSGSENGGASEDNPSVSRESKASEKPDEKVGKKKKKKAKDKSKAPGFGGWVNRFMAHREKQKKKPHTPGVWVIYFSLAALPLFALGQSLVDPEDDSRRRATFLQMAVYVASGLGLLVTTSLLGLRRYLRQRKAKVPAALNASWLGLGGVLIVGFLVLGAFLPRPHSEVPWFGIQRAGKADREASRYARSGGSAGKGEGSASDQTEKGKGNASGKGGEKGGKGGSKNDGGGKGKDSGGKDSKGKSQGNSKSAEGSKGDGKDSEASKDKNDGEEKSRDGENDQEGEEAKDDSGSKDGSSGSTPKTELGTAVQKIAGFLKWLVFGIVAILVVIGLFLGVLKYLAPFTEWARKLLDAIRNWWANLFGGGAKKAAAERAAEARPFGPVRPPPFSEYSNPFEDGSAKTRRPAELVAYTFAALDSWAWDRGFGRNETETPLEFAGRLGEEFAELKPTLRRLANLYARVAYGDGQLPADTLKFLEQVWDALVHGVTAGEAVAAE